MTEKELNQWEEELNARELELDNREKELNAREEELDIREEGLDILEEELKRLYGSPFDVGDAEEATEDNSDVRDVLTNILGSIVKEKRHR